jgi:hypothetical protein
MGTHIRQVQIQLRHLKTLSKPEAKLATLDNCCAKSNWARQAKRQHKGVNPYQLFTYAANTKTVPVVSESPAVSFASSSIPSQQHYYLAIPATYSKELGF